MFDLGIKDVMYDPATQTWEVWLYGVVDKTVYDTGNATWLVPLDDITDIVCWVSTCKVSDRA